MKCPCGCHKLGSPDCSECCEVFKVTRRTDIIDDPKDVELTKCRRCGGTGILIRETPGLFKSIKLQVGCFECEGDGYR